MSNKSEPKTMETKNINELEEVVESETKSKAEQKTTVFKKREPKNWDKIVKEIEEQEKESTESADDIFKKLYSDADDDTRRAMNKSFIESNGTTLSMDWKKVGKKVVKPYDEKNSDDDFHSDSDEDLEEMHENIAPKEETITSLNGLNDDNDCNEGSQIQTLNKPNQTEPKDQICDEGKSREPDCDSLKMFVGQIPKDWTESDCQQLLREFGDIYSINLLKDKRTAKSKGCCFVTYYTRRAALEAQNALHNIRTLPSCHHPIQMKPADTENRNERKLFVGMLSKTMNEQEIKNMFSTYGVIEECSILRDSSGQSKGCAFVTYSSRTSASNAIKSLNHSTTMEGCTSPLVVKFADTQKDKDQRRSKQTLMQQLWNPTSSPLSTSLVTNPYLHTLAALTSAAQQQQLATTLALQQQCLTTDLSLASALANNPGAVLMALTGSSQPKMSTQSTPLTLSSHFNSSKLDMFTGIRDQLTFSPSLSTSPALSVSGVQHLSSSLSQTPGTNATISKQAEGPEGANLFIYHLPPEFTDNDLITTFVPFGNVVSAKVFIDKNSNLSKCFGFVSYDNALSAQTAIQAMHGFQIRNKRLKVQLKKTRDKPY